MSIHPLAGKPAPRELLTNIPRLVSAYYTAKPDADNPRQRVAFGTSGHRGSSFEKRFNEDHILAIAQSICDLRRSRGVTGPLFLGMDTHALSEAAHATALEVFAANGVTVFIQSGLGYTPTPVISHAILAHNRSRKNAVADGVVVTPSHNPPEDGGFKYNPPHGGPADAETTGLIEDRANTILENNNKAVRRMVLEKAMSVDTTHTYDFVRPYVQDLSRVIDMDAAVGAGLKIGVDPLGGAGMGYWAPIAEHYGLDINVVNKAVDPAFGFMTVDKDGKIRMDCSSPYAMSRLIDLRESFDVAFGNDPDTDRHGIVTRGSGLLNPNHYLSVAVWYLFRNRPQWRIDAAIGKTLVSSAMIDRVAAALKRPLAEVPVGFKWFVQPLLEGRYGFGGEESAGASFLRSDGTVWTTDKDGIIMDLLAAEIIAKTDRRPDELYTDLEARFGTPVYERIDAPATPEQKAAFRRLQPDMVSTDSLAGEKIVAKLTHAPANGASIGGLKVVTENGWFAARPSGTEDIYKIYAESFKGKSHLRKIQEEARGIVNSLFKP